LQISAQIPRFLLLSIDGGKVGREATMPAPTIFLSRLIGVVALIMSVAMATDKATTVATIGIVVSDRGLMVVLGIASVVVGAAIVLIHNVWAKGLWPLVVTLCGWALLLRGVLILFLPPDVIASAITALRVADFFYLYAVIPLVLGAYLTLRGFMATETPEAAAPPPQAVAKPAPKPGRRPRRRR
jgi:hypothetical protein